MNIPYVRCDGGVVRRGGSCVRAGAWRKIEPLGVVRVGPSHDDFEDVSGGWAGAVQLEKRRGNLVVDTEGRATAIRRGIADRERHAVGF